MVAAHFEPQRSLEAGELPANVLETAAAREAELRGAAAKRLRRLGDRRVPLIGRGPDPRHDGLILARAQAGGLPHEGGAALFLDLVGEPLERLSRLPFGREQPDGVVQ